MFWVLPVGKPLCSDTAPRLVASMVAFFMPPYLFHYFDGFHPVLRWGIKQHTVIEGLEHGLHGVHRPHQPDQLGCDVIDGPSHGPTQGWRGGRAAGPPAMVRHSRRRRVWLDARASAAAVSRGDAFIMDRIPQDHDESRAKVFPGKTQEEKKVLLTRQKDKMWIQSWG